MSETEPVEPVEAEPVECVEELVDPQPIEVLGPLDPWPVIPVE